MDSNTVSLLTVALVLLTTIVILVERNWRIKIPALGIQYIMVFWLVSLSWPWSMAAVKLITGWIACAVIALAQASISPDIPSRARSWPTERFFRLLAAMLVILALWSITPQAAAWIPGLSLAQLVASVTLIGMGLLQLGLAGDVFPTMIALLTVLSGFEIIYAVVEASILVAGLLAGVNLGIALAGAYLINLMIAEKTA